MMRNLGGGDSGHAKNVPRDIVECLREIVEMREEMKNERKNGMGKEAMKESETEVGEPSEVGVARIRKVWEIAKNPDVAAFCRVRLGLLESKYDVWSLESRDMEMIEQQGLGGDFLTVPKVDTHLHNSAMMTAKQLSKYMHYVYERDKDRVHGKDKEGRGVTIGETMIRNGFQPER